MRKATLLNGKKHGIKDNQCIGALTDKGYFVFVGEENQGTEVENFALLPDDTIIKFDDGTIMSIGQLRRQLRSTRSKDFGERVLGHWSFFTQPYEEPILRTKPDERSLLLYPFGVESDLRTAIGLVYKDVQPWSIEFEKIEKQYDGFFLTLICCNSHGRSKAKFSVVYLEQACMRVSSVTVTYETRLTSGRVVKYHFDGSGTGTGIYKREILEQ